MNIVMEEAGYLLSYLFKELENFKIANPVFCEISDRGIKRTKEFYNYPIEKAIKKAIELLENSNTPTVGVCAIFPVLTRNNREEKLENALMSVIKYEGKVVKILQKYYFDDYGKLYLNQYKAIETQNVDKEELLELGVYYLRGIMKYKEAKDIWVRSAKNIDEDLRKELF